MAINDELLDHLMEGLGKLEDLLGEDGLLQELKKALIEKALGAELTHHLGYARGNPTGRGSGNSINGKNKKTVKDKDGQLEVSVPSDRQGTFEPQLIKKGQTRIWGFDEKVISMYARGMSETEATFPTMMRPSNGECPSGTGRLCLPSLLDYLKTACKRRYGPRMKCNRNGSYT